MQDSKKIVCNMVFWDGHKCDSKTIETAIDSAKEYLMGWKEEDDYFSISALDNKIEVRVMTLFGEITDASCMISVVCC